MAARCEAVERAIVVMRRRLDEPLSLGDLAEVAILSPFHFVRVFRERTGIPPAQFFWALRLEAAKRLLLTTEHRVLEVCYEVGYNSIGTFTSRFTELVGVSPTRFRRLARALTANEQWLRHRLRPTSGLPEACGVGGRLSAPDGFTGLAFVGLFASRVPQGRPVACAVIAAPASYCLAPVPEGRYYVFAIAVSGSEGSLAYLLPETALRGVAGPVIVDRTLRAVGADVVLRPPRLTDPPILVAVPSLIDNGLEHSLGWADAARSSSELDRMTSTRCAGAISERRFDMLVRHLK
jgi:AraC-like DNA-binding protein